MLKKFINYCKACYDELAHSAVVVLSASLVIALVVWAMDSVFKFVMTGIYSLGI